MVRNKTAGRAKTSRVSRQEAEGQETWSNFSYVFRKYYLWRYLHFCKMNAKQWMAQAYRSDAVVHTLYFYLHLYEEWQRMKDAAHWDSLWGNCWEAGLKVRVCSVLALCLCVYKYTYIHTYICMKIRTQSHWLSAKNSICRSLVSAVSRKDKPFPVLLKAKLDVKLP